MPSTLSPPPERDLPPGHHSRRRRQLVEVIADHPRPSKLRAWVPVIAAASVLALVAGGVFVNQAVRSKQAVSPADNPPPPTVSATTALKPPKDKPRKGYITKPEVTEITGAALQKFFDDCVREDKKMAGGVDDDPSSIQAFDRPLFGYQFTMPKQLGYPKPQTRSYLVAVRGSGSRVDDRAACSRSNNSRPLPAGQMLSHGEKGDGYLYQIVAGAHDGIGFLMPRVASVTFQARAKGSVETYATVRDGMWIYPDLSYSESETPPDEPLIGLRGFFYRYRGYDASGKLIYDSDRDGPFAKDCYTDPRGKEVLVINSVKNPTPETCLRTYEWTAP